MDKVDAIKLSENYLHKVREAKIPVVEAWLFGSYAMNKQHEHSDIDIAIILADSVVNSFETDVKLMTIRKGEETIIEPHTFSKEEFKNNTPIVQQIISNGIRLAV